jgi:hypothetical protein
MKLRKVFGVAAGLVFLVCIILAAWRGGQNPFESPISSIPSLLIDYAYNETEIFVHGLNDFRYTNLSITISNGTNITERSRENSYFIYTTAGFQNFTLNITVMNKKKEYTFNGTIQIAPIEHPAALLTLYEEKKDRINTYDLSQSNLPWRKMMERVK